MRIDEESLDRYARWLRAKLEYLLLTVDEDDPARIRPQVNDEQRIRRNYQEWPRGEEQ